MKIYSGRIRRRVQTGEHAHGTEAAALLAAMALSVVAWYWISARKLLWNDELLGLISDRVGSWRAWLGVQLDTPVSLDPPLYHALSHGLIGWMGANATAVRLPSLLGFLLMQAALYGFVRKVAGARGAVVAVLLPLSTVLLPFAAEARPYGLLYGLYAATAWAYQSASRRTENRRWALAALATAVGLTILTHYFGVLILVPLVLAEGARFWVEGRVDGGLWMAVAAGAAAVVGVVPFRRGAGTYAGSYYNRSLVSWHLVPATYRELVGAALAKPAWMVGLLVLAVFVPLAVCWRMRGRELALPVGEWMLLAGMALLPVWGWMLGSVVGTLAPRYLFGFAVAACAAWGMALGPRLRRKTVLGGAVAGLLVAGLGNLWLVDRVVRLSNADIRAGLGVSAEAERVLRGSGGMTIYISNTNRLLYARSHSPLPAAVRLAPAFATEWPDTNEITMRNLAAFAGWGGASMDQIAGAKVPVLLVLFPTLDGRWEPWLRAHGTVLLPRGEAFGGVLYEATKACSGDDRR